MLLSGGTHGDNAAFRIGYNRSSFAKSTGMRDHGITFLKGRQILTILNAGQLDRKFLHSVRCRLRYARATRAVVFIFFRCGFSETSRQYLIGFVQNVLDILDQGFPEVIPGSIFNRQR